MNDDFKRKVEAVAPTLAGLLLAVPVLVAYYPPMTDLGFHEGAIGVLRHFADTSMFPPGLYERNLGHPNQLFHLIGWALSYVVSTRWAVKLIVAATVIAIPVSAGRLARHFGASPLAALMVAPMTLGWLFGWGLVTNLLGLAVLLAVLPGLDRFARVPTGKGAALSVLTVVLLYQAHGAMMSIYAGAAIGLALLRPWSRKETGLRLVPFVAGVVITLAEAVWVARYETPAVRAMPRLWHSLWHKLQHTLYILLPATEVAVQVAVFSLCTLVIVLFFWLRTRERRTQARAEPGQESHSKGPRAWALSHRWELFVVACFAAYLTFPLTLSGTTLVYQRWFPPAFCVLVVIAAPRDLWVREARVALFAVMMLPLATLLVAWPSFVDSNRQFLALERILPYIEPGSAVAGVDLSPPDPSRTYTLGAASGRILATRGGRLAYCFTDSPISPVVIPRRYQWSDSLMRLAFDSGALRPAHDLRRYRYVLLRVNEPSLQQLAIYALSPEAEYVTTSGEWILFRSRGPTLPLTSREGRIMGPPPEDLRDRIAAMVQSLKDAQNVQTPENPSPAPSAIPP